MQPLTPSTLRHPLPEHVMAARHKISILEQRALSAGESPRAAARLIAEIRRLSVDLDRLAVEVQDQDETFASTIARLRRAEERAHLLFELSPVACVVIDRDGFVVEGNDAAACLLNLSRRHLPGKPFHRFVSADRVTFLLRLNEVAASGQSDTWGISLRPRERGALRVACTAALEESSGRLCLLLSTCVNGKAPSEPEEPAEPQEP